MDSTAIPKNGDSNGPVLHAWAKWLPKSCWNYKRHWLPQCGCCSPLQRTIRSFAGFLLVLWAQQWSCKCSVNLCTNQLPIHSFTPKRKEVEGVLFGVHYTQALFEVSEGQNQLESIHLSLEVVFIVWSLWTFRCIDYLSLPIYSGFDFSRRLYFSWWTYWSLIFAYVSWNSTGKGSSSSWSCRALAVSVQIPVQKGLIRVQSYHKCRKCASLSAAFPSPIC